MRVLAGVLVGIVVAWLLLFVVTVASPGGIGPLEMLVFGGPAFALGYWLTVRRRGPEH